MRKHKELEGFPSGNKAQLKSQQRRVANFQQSSSYPTTSHWLSRSLLDAQVLVLGARFGVFVALRTKTGIILDFEENIMLNKNRGFQFWSLLI